MNTDRRARAWRGAGRGFVLGAALCAALVCAAPAAGLEPPTQHQIDQYRKDGSLTERIRSAEALGNQRAWRHSSSGICRTYCVTRRSAFR